MMIWVLRGRDSEMLQARNILTFRLGPEKVYLVTKAHNIQHMFRTTANLNQERFALMLQKYVWGSTPDDYARFANDGSGKGRLPTPGYEGTPNDRRYWAPLHHILHDFLSGSRETGVLAGVYQRELTALLDGDGSQDFPVGEWRSAHVYAFLQRHMAEAATATLVGQRLMELNGGAAEFLKTFWEFDRIAASLVWGLPRWMNRGAWRARDTFHAAVKKYLFPPAEQFDFDAPGTSEADWEPVFGSRANREMVRWMRRAGFDEQTITGAVATLFVFGTNGNTIPITGWCVMEIVKSLSLLRRVRDEVATAMVNVDPATGRGEIDAQRLVALPLLQSIYTEAMRLHVSMNVTREIAGPMKMEGFTLERGALLQAATEITHQDEAIWGAPGHPATEFWADRHIKCVEKIDSSGGIVRQPQFVMAGKATEFFPYGTYRGMERRALIARGPRTDKAFQGVAYPSAQAASLPSRKSC